MRELNIIREITNIEIPLAGFGGKYPDIRFRIAPDHSGVRISIWCTTKGAETHFGGLNFDQIELLIDALYELAKQANCGE